MAFPIVRKPHGMTADMVQFLIWGMSGAGMLVQLLDEKRSLAKSLDSELRRHSGVRTQQ